MPRIDRDIVKQRQGLKSRNRYNGGKPDLRVSHAVKIADDFDHTKNVIDYHVESSWFQDQTTQNSGNYRDMYILYDAYNTFIPEEYFNYVVNPLNSSQQDKATFPARIRPYSIIRPNIDLLLGEYDKRPLNYTVVTTSNDVVSRVEQEIHDAVIANLEQQFVNELNSQGMQTGQQTQETEPLQNIKSKKLSSFKDDRATRAQNTINRSMNELKLEHEWRRCFKDWLIAGEVYTHRGVFMDDLFYERISPLDFDYDKAPDNEFVEDGSWGVRRKYMTPSDIVTNFWEELEEYEIDDLEEQDSSLPFTSSYYNTLFGNTYRTEEDLRRIKIPVYHVEWKYYAKIGILTYSDEFGVEQEIEVAENYKVEKHRGEKVKWHWIPEIWEAWRIDTNYAEDRAGTENDGSIYLGIKRKEVQRSMMNNMAYNKLGYNGLRYSDTHSRNISITELGLPYQVLHQILHYKLELTIAKSKGKIALLDINTIPNKKGWDEEKFFYYAEAMGFGLIDRNQIGTDKTWNQYQVLDMGLYDHIKNLIDVMEYVKSEWDQLVGISPQRKGQTAASETATGVSTARYQSALISERAFSRFEEFLERELQAIVDYSKYANIATKKEPFYRDDFTMELLSATPEDYMESEYGVYVSNMSKDVEDITMLKQLVPNMAQNADPSQVMEMVMSRNVSSLKNVLNEKKTQEMDAAQKAQASQEEIEKRKLEIQKEYRAIEFEFDNLLQEGKFDREERLAHIEGQYKLADTDQPADALTPAEAEVGLQKNNELMLKAQEGREKTVLEREKMASGERQSQAKVDASIYAADKTLEVAKENKNQFDKAAPKGK